MQKIYEQDVSKSDRPDSLRETISWNNLVIRFNKDYFPCTIFFLSALFFKGYGLQALMLVGCLVHRWVRTGCKAGWFTKLALWTLATHMCRQNTTPETFFFFLNDDFLSVEHNPYTILLFPWFYFTQGQEEMGGELWRGGGTYFFCRLNYTSTLPTKTPIGEAGTVPE